MTVHINMNDPATKRLLGVVPGNGQTMLESPQRQRELVQLAGDAPDPMGTGPNGSQTTYHLNRTALCHPLISYKDFVIEADVYKYENEPMVVHLICPRCRHYLTIPATKKVIELEVGAGPGGQGKLSVEPFECTWEMPDAGEHKVGLIGSGTTLCRWKVGIDNNVAKDA